jgi:heme/copper-type cytochrome/quinol oxidase subunit 2
LQCWGSKPSPLSELEAATLYQEIIKITVTLMAVVIITVVAMLLLTFIISFNCQNNTLRLRKVKYLI